MFSVSSVCHISINPFKDERLKDKQVRQIAERCEQVYGYVSGDHQRVIVEHIKDGRQHFHVMWNRVSIATGKAVWPGHHWLKSKQVSREMEVELGLKHPSLRKIKTPRKIKTTKTPKLGSEPLKPKHHNPTSRPTRHYAGMLGEMPEMTTRKKKGGKGDGAGGGAASTTSALKLGRKSYNNKPVRKYSDDIGGLGNGPERRRKNMWVGVERRRQGPK